MNRQLLLGGTVLAISAFAPSVASAQAARRDVGRGVQEAYRGVAAGAQLLSDKLGGGLHLYTPAGSDGAVPGYVVHAKSVMGLGDIWGDVLDLNDPGSADLHEPERSHETQLIARYDVAGELGLTLRQKLAVNALASSVANYPGFIYAQALNFPWDQQPRADQAPGQKPIGAETQPQAAATDGHDQQPQADQAAAQKAADTGTQPQAAATDGQDQKEPASDAQSHGPRLLKDYRAQDEKRLAAILKPAQMKRLRELDLQWRSALALRDPKIAEDAGLTPDESVVVHGIGKDYYELQAKLWPDFMRLARFMITVPECTDESIVCENLAELAKPYGPNLEQLDKIRPTASGKVLAALPPEKQAKWREMTGKPFRFKENVFPNDEN